MAASLSVRVYTGSAAGTESAVVTGIDLESADNATNTLANRQANPINVGGQSYEKWLKLKLDTAPANGVTNFKIWGDGDLKHLYLMQVYDACKQAGFQNISFVAPGREPALEKAEK